MLTASSVHRLEGFQQAAGHKKGASKKRGRMVRHARL